MAILTFDPATANISIELAAGAEGPPILIGETEPAFDLTNQSTVRGEMRTWPITTEPLLTATKDAIKALYALDEHVEVTGDLVGGSPIDVKVKDNGWQIMPGSVPLLWTGTLVLEEAE